MTPKMSTAAISSVVRTGRRMNSSVFTASLRRLLRLDLHARAGHEPQLAVGADARAGGHALGDDRAGAQPPAELDRTRLHGRIRLHHEPIWSLLPGLHRLRGHDDR